MRQLGGCGCDAFCDAQWPNLLLTAEIRCEFICDEKNERSRLRCRGAFRSNSGQESGIVFDVKKFGATLGDAHFFAYAAMIMSLHRVLEDVASFGEGCCCHEPLLTGRSQHERAKALSDDFLGIAHPRCPMSAMRAPELAAGELQTRLLNSDKRRLELVSVSLADSSLSATDWSRVLETYDQGIAFLKSGLDVKLAFWNTLPYKIAGMAHYHEGTARRIARECMESFQSSSAAAPFQFHHALSRSVFVDHVAEVERFVAGVPRADLHPDLLAILASCMCWPTAERVIEATHKDAKKDIGLNKSSPVSFSLAIRSTSVLEEVCRKHLPLLLENINRARSFKSVVRDLSLKKHPALVDHETSHNTKIHTILSRIMYRADVEDLFHNTLELQREHVVAKANQTRTWSKWMIQQGKLRAPKLNHTIVLEHALAQHVQSTGIVSDGCILELPAPLPDQKFQTVREVVQPSTSSAAIFVSDFDPDEASMAEGVATKMFKVLHMTPGKWKTITLPAVLGGRVPSKAMLLAPLEVVARSDLGSTAVVCHATGLSPQLLVWQDHDLALLRAHARVWEADSAIEPLFLLPDLHADFETVSHVLHILLEQRAVETQPSKYVTFSVDAPEVATLNMLRDLNYVHTVAHDNELICRLTVGCLRKLQHGFRVHNPVAAAELRPEVSLEGRTVYELQLLLMDDGWVWQHLPSTKAARARLQNYKQDSPKLWYSLTVVSVEYLLCLLKFPA